MSSRPRLLIVEDDQELRRTLERCIVRDGFEALQARDGVEALEKLESGLQPDLILTDLEMPRAGGREVLKAAAKRGIPVVVLTGHGSVEIAVELMREGAANFLTKPFSPATLRSVLEDTFGRRVPSAKDRPGEGQAPIIGAHPAFRSALALADNVAETDASVLITGESGTGKEVVARNIHRASKRAKQPFIAVNCAAIPEPLFESELFGHVKGAFTGATQARAGRFQLAEGGTLFFDEIGDMPLSFQVKLLRVLQERQIDILGEGVSRMVNVRVLAATHRDLVQMVADAEFREDLYYRLNVIELHIPALRERREDIPLLVTHFLEGANARHGRAVTGITPFALERLVSYRWPGNVRELANLVERTVILKRSGEIDIQDLPPVLLADSPSAAAPGAAVSTATHLPSGDPVTLPAAGIDLRKMLDGLESSLIDQALERTGGNRNAAAQLLGLNRTTLVEKLKKKGR